MCTCVIVLLYYYMCGWVIQVRWYFGCIYIKIHFHNIIILSVLPTPYLIHSFNYFTFFKSAIISKKINTICCFPSKKCLLHFPIALLPLPKSPNIDHLNLFLLFVKFDLQKPNAAFIYLYMEL